MFQEIATELPQLGWATFYTLGYALLISTQNGVSMETSETPLDPPLHPEGGPPVRPDGWTPSDTSPPIEAFPVRWQYTQTIECLWMS